MIAEPLAWQDMQTDESKGIVELLRNHGFEQVDAYRYNSASIRIRVIDKRFEGLSNEHRDAMVEPILDLLPENTQSDIVNLLTLAPSDLDQRPRKNLRSLLLNTEFEYPLRSTL